MTLAGIIVLGAGILVVMIGLIFMIPYRNVKRFAGNKVQGKITDMVWNAAAYNESLDKAANVEHLKIAGTEFIPGKRNPAIQVGEVHINADDGKSDPNKVVHGRGPSNMYHKVYQYVVNGREYTRADGVRYDKGTVEKWLGKTVNVYYNPENPQQSTLSNGGGYKITMMILYIAGGLSILAGLVLLFLGM